MPGKHYKGVLNKNFDFKSEKPKNKKNYNKLTTSQAEKISEQVTMSAIKGGMPRGIGNYKGSGNFAMKNKMLSDSAKNGIPMQKNYSGMPRMTGSTQEKTENKKSTDKVVDPDTSVVTDVATQRLIKAGAPKEVIDKAKAKFIAREKSKKK